MKHRNLETNQTILTSTLLAFFTMCVLMLFNLLPLGMAESELPKMYFGDKLLWKAGLLGDYQTTFLPLPPRLGYVTVDAANEKIYYMERYGRFLWKMDLDGRNVEEVIGDFHGFPGPHLFDAVEGKFYWCGWTSIYRLDVGAEYSEREILIDTDFHTAYIFLDEVSRRLYWLEEEENDEFETIYTLRSANLDGGDIKNHVTGMKIGDVGGWFGIGIDNVNKHVYWLDYDPYDWDDYTKIRRANLEDADGVVDVSEDGGEIIIDLGDAWAQKFLVDEANRMLYWFADDYSYKADEYVTFLYSANFDDETPTPEKVVETRSFWINYMTLSDGKVYWTDSDEAPAGDDIDSVWTVSVDGTDEPENLTFIDFPSGIAVDTADEELYWTVPNLGIIRRANLDGTDMVDLITGLNQPEDVAIDPVDEKLYWTEGPRQDDASGEEIDVWSIRRADIDGTNKEVFYYHEYNDEAFRGLAIDAKRRMVYWISQWGIEAMKTDEGGYFFSAIEYPVRLIYDNIMAEGYEELFDLAIDSVNSQLYWITGQFAFANLWEYTLGAIKRSNLDGSRIRPIASGLINPRGIAIDPINEKIYWTAEEEGGKIGKVQWANFDGTDVDDVIEETYPGVKDIALGLVGVKPLSVYPTGDVNGDFQVNAYDAALILQFSVGIIDKFPVDELLGMSPENAVARHYKVSVPQMKAYGGERISVPIEINDDAEGFLSGGVTLKYDTNVLRAEGASLKLNGAYWKANTKLDGEVRVAFVSLEEIEQGNTLFVVEFDVLKSAEGREIPLILDYVELSNSLSVQKTNGLLTVLPNESRLLQNYPNPFNPETWIPYQLSADADVTLSIYDVHGSFVHQLTLGNQPAGSYLTKDKAAHWDGRNRAGELAASGVYFYVLKAVDGGKVFLHSTRKMVILK